MEKRNDIFEITLRFFLFAEKDVYLLDKTKEFSRWKK